MQRKCHRCDRLFTPDSNSTWCPDCREGKPVAPRKTKEQLEKEREARLEKAFKYTRYCVQCGKKFYTNDTRKVICGDWECEENKDLNFEEQAVGKENKNEDTKHWVWG